MPYNARRVCRVPLATVNVTVRRAAFNLLKGIQIMAKARASLAPAAPTLQWNVDAASQKAIVSEDGTTWRYATDAENAERAAALAPVPTAPEPAPAPAPAPAPKGFALVPGTNEQIPIPGQEVVTDGRRSEGEIKLTSPAPAAATAAPGDAVASLQRQVNDRIAERDTLQREVDRLSKVNSQLTETNKLAQKHIEELQSTGTDSMGMPKTPGM